MAESPTRPAPEEPARARGAGQGVLVVSLDHRIVWANQVARRALEGGGGSLVGRPCHAVLRDHPEPCPACPIEAVRASGRAETCPSPGSGDPTARWEAALHPVCGPQGEVEELVVSLTTPAASASAAQERQATEADLSLLYTLSEMDSRGCSLEEVADFLVQQVLVRIEGDLAVLYLPSRDARYLTLAAQAASPALRDRLGVALGAGTAAVHLEERADSPLWRALRGRRPAVLTGPAQIEGLLADHARTPLLRRALAGQPEALGLGTAILAPLRAEGQPVGLLLVGAGEPRSDAPQERLRHLCDGLGGILRRKLTRDERRRHHVQTSAILSSVQDGVLGLDTDGRVTFANRSAVEQLGWQRIPFQGRTLGQLNALADAEGEDAHPVVAAIRAGQRVHQQEARLRGAAGAPINVVFSVAPIEEQGEVRGAVATFADIGARKRTEEDLRRSLHHLRLALSGTVQALGRMAEMRDPYTAGHQQRVARLAARICERLALPTETVELVRLAALVHDIGKIAIPVELLTKPGHLAEHEVHLIRTHTTVGWEILQEAHLHEAIADIARQHHERLDGSGYPDGLRGQAIRREARIIAVADTVEAMASHRPYRPARGVDEALAEIFRQRGRFLEPDAVDACLHLFRVGGFSFQE